MSTDDLDAGVVDQVLTHGALELEGRLLAASNASFLGEVSLDGVTLRCVYKPIRGERPLWDFPSGTLAGRERLARVVSDLGGWGIVPQTVLRDGSFGPGMCQRWIDVDSAEANGDVADSAEMVDIIPVAASTGIDHGWIAVLEAEDRAGNDVLLVHRDVERLRDMAVFDVVINNADRKGGHVLVDRSGGLWGCDHGVSFHDEPKLRTVLWGWADEPLRDSDRAMLERLLGYLDDRSEPEFADLLTRREIDALHTRAILLLADGRMPTPEGSWPPIPWPAF